MNRQSLFDHRRQVGAGRSDNGRSVSMEIGQAAEHLAWAELILQGWAVIQASQGSPYDLLVELDNGKFCRVQVKGTLRPYPLKVHKRDRSAERVAYRYAMRASRVDDRKIRMEQCDVIAFVALDIRSVAFIPVKNLLTAGGTVKSLLELKTRTLEYKRTGVSGKDPALCGRFLEDYATFDPDGD